MNDLDAKTCARLALESQFISETLNYYRSAGLKYSATFLENSVIRRALSLLRILERQANDEWLGKNT
jgi:hypothetical protein